MQVINCRAKTYLGRGDDPSLFAYKSTCTWRRRRRRLGSLPVSDVLQQQLNLFLPHLCLSQPSEGLNKQHGALLLLVGNAFE